ncbi:biotin--[acetyl-CoA-carboxylase] ligase [Nocardioides sp. KIGAM211]|uniref:biotin--[biotin carboxyl-carrier protein] ligase n=1 Tax=Nocardioides luti TaxID=2761101 RepID=A0A7X0VD64_9ACTN|nr:biotin--[acetyl-CoA-carboxylase] ligase [Nocardioides luti]MBB6628963.1 biotin--[acetyl-CoA-carboxylase] ligase [Nocardioides luti]
MTSDLPARPPLDVPRLTAAAAVEVVAATPSTNALAVARAREGAAEGLVVVTEHQTAGRGRLDRTWETPERAALTFSVLLRPEVPAARWPWLPLLTGYVVGEVLREHGADAGVKWPNDVLVGPLKLVGILVERVDSPSGPAAVVGIGINVTTTRAELPVETATSLALEGVDVDRSDLLLALVARLLGEYAAWQRDPGTTLRAAYEQACVTIGREVRVELPTGAPLTGTATGIDAGGRLLVRGPDGETAVGAGDVVHVRAVGGGSSGG